MRIALGRVIDAAGFAAVAFASAEDLLTGEAASRARCFVLDIHLPGMSGIDLARRLASMGVSVPVIFITAKDNAQQRRISDGAAGYLVKPFAPEALIAAIGRALED